MSFVHWSTYNRKLPNVCPQHEGCCACAVFSTCAQHVHCPNLELKSDWFHVVHGSVAPLAVAGGWGAELKAWSHVFVLFTDLYNQWLRFVHSITKNKALVSWPLLIPFMTYESILTTDGSIRIAISYVRCTVAAARQRLSWYTDGISHEFHKNGKTYQNTDSMSLLEMKQLFMWLLHKIVKITGKWISRSIFWKKHVRLQAILWTVIAQVPYVLHCTCTAWDGPQPFTCCCCCCCCCCLLFSFIMAISLYVQSKTPYWRMRSA